jgi:hypothetical protein
MKKSLLYISTVQHQGVRLLGSFPLLPTSIQDAPTSATLWRTVRPPTPPRATYPISNSTTKNTTDGAPPVPSLSYWLPDTPSPFSTILSPKSPTNPFLSPPAFCPYMLFLTAAPLIPLPPLSVFDQALSPTFLRSRSPLPIRTTFLLPASPLLSPRFLHPRTPPFPAPVVGGRKTSIYDVVLNIAERKGSVASMVRLRR